MASKLFPMLSCADLGRSLAFYGELLGGIENYRFPDAGEPAFVALSLGGSEIGLGGIAAEPMPARSSALDTAASCVTMSLHSRPCSIIEMTPAS